MTGVKLPKRIIDKLNEILKKHETPSPPDKETTENLKRKEKARQNNGRHINPSRRK